MNHRYGFGVRRHQLYHPGVFATFAFKLYDSYVICICSRCQLLPSSMHTTTSQQLVCTVVCILRVVQSSQYDNTIHTVCIICMCILHWIRARLHMHRTSVSILLVQSMHTSTSSQHSTVLRASYATYSTSNNIVLYSRVCIPLSSYDVVCILCILLLCYAYYYYLVEYRV